MAMENDPLVDDFPIEKKTHPLSAGISQPFLITAEYINYAHDSSSPNPSHLTSSK
jgi:hypothetical protein